MRLGSYGIESSKLTGKLRFVLSTSVFFLILHVLLAVRAAAGLSAWFGFDAPATAEKIELACSPCSGRSA